MDNLILLDEQRAKPSKEQTLSRRGSLEVWRLAQQLSLLICICLSHSREIQGLRHMPFTANLLFRVVSPHHYQGSNITSHLQTESFYFRSGCLPGNSGHFRFFSIFFPLETLLLTWPHTHSAKPRRLTLSAPIKPWLPTWTASGSISFHSLYISLWWLMN